MGCKLLTFCKKTQRNLVRKTTELAGRSKVDLLSTDPKVPHGWCQRDIVVQTASLPPPPLEPPPLWFPITAVIAPLAECADSGKGKVLSIFIIFIMWKQTQVSRTPAVVAPRH